MTIPHLKEGNKCPQCITNSKDVGEHPVGRLKVIHGDITHLKCPICESAYHIDKSNPIQAIKKISGYICPFCRTLLDGKPPRCRRCNQKLKYND